MIIKEGDCLVEMQKLEPNSIDLICTDPPYALVSGTYKEGKTYKGGFMGKNWDAVLPSIEIWKECLRILKPGAFAFVMCSPRQDVLAHMIVRLGDAGFETNFTPLFHAFAQGFPKAANIGKMVDKRNGRSWHPEVKEYLNQQRNNKDLSFQQINTYLNTATNGGGVASAIMGDKQFNELPTVEVYNKLKTLLDLDNRFDELIEREEAEREIVGKNKTHGHVGNSNWDGKVCGYKADYNVTAPATPQAKELDGFYAGYQPKPAVEVILVVMKPLSEKSYVDQALSNGKGCVNFEDCRIPYQSESDFDNAKGGDSAGYSRHVYGDGWYNEQAQSKHIQEKGRFPANLLCSDDVLNDGKIRKSTGGNGDKSKYSKTPLYSGYESRIGAGLGGYGDTGSFSRYFSLDAWAEKTLPFLICPKASKSEKNKGLENSHVSQDEGVGFRTQETDTTWVRFRVHPIPNNKVLAKYLRDARLKKDLSMIELGEYFKTSSDRINHGGCVSNWESGANIPTPEEWVKLKQILEFDDRYDKQMTETREELRPTFKKREPQQNTHATVKPVKLMSYLITMGSRPNETILDPFMGSGTTGIAALQLGRRFIGIEKEKEYVEIAKKRLKPYITQTKLAI